MERHTIWGCQSVRGRKDDCDGRWQPWEKSFKFSLKKKRRPCFVILPLLLPSLISVLKQICRQTSLHRVSDLDSTMGDIVMASFSTFDGEMEMRLHDRHWYCSYNAVVKIIAIITASLWHRMETLHHLWCIQIKWKGYNTTQTDI